MRQTINKIASFFKNNKSSLGFALVAITVFAGIYEFSGTTNTHLENSQDILLTEETHQNILRNARSIDLNNKTMDIENPEDFELTEETYQQLSTTKEFINCNDNSMDVENPKDVLLTEETYKQF